MQFIAEHWEGIVATIAFLQTWVIKAGGNLVHRRRIKIYPSGSPEIGYSVFGPTIGLYGTLRALNGDVFVRQIRVKVHRIRTNGEHWFAWLAFRSPVMMLGESAAPPPELPSSFIVSSSQPYRYNITFHDADIGEEIRPHMQRLSLC